MREEERIHSTEGGEKTDLNTFFRRKNVVFECTRPGTIFTTCKCAGGVKNVLRLLRERFSDSPQHNLVFMTATANHTVKYQIYTD